MSLDPQMASLLAALNAQGSLELGNLTAEGFRAAASAKRMIRDDPELVGRVREQHIDGPNGSIPLRIYQPSAEGAHTLLVYFHGGGFVLGDLDSHDNICRALCNALPAVVVSVGYRVAPESRFPAAATDALAATCWTAAHARELGGDARRLVVCGDSAGGNLGAVVCQQARNNGGPKIAHQVLLYPVCDSSLAYDSYKRVGTGYFLETELMRWFWTQYLVDAADGANPMASPIRATSLAGLPSATVVTAGYDPLCDEGEAYAARLAEAGVPTRHIPVPGAIHGFISFIGAMELSNRILCEVVDSVNAALA